MKSIQTILLLLFALPVLGAHYFSVDQNPLIWISALLSVSILAVLLRLVIARLPRGTIRNSIGLVTLIVPACYFIAQFLSYYLQGSYFNQQFYFHFNIDAVAGSWASYWPLIMLSSGWLLAICLSFIYFRNRLEHLNPSSGLLALLLFAALFTDPGLRQSALAALTADRAPEVISLEEVDWQRLKLNREALQGRDVRASPGKNLVLVFMEGLDKIYTDNSIFPELTPNLNSLRTPGAQLERLYQVPGSEWTMGGLVSSLCGTQLLHNLGLDGNTIMFTGFLDRATCLPDVLNSAGYQQVFMGGASQEFGGKGGFVKAHSYDRVLGRDELIPRLDDPSYLGGWGLYDESLLELAIQEYERLAASGAPFNLTLLTVDTHHPTGEPSPGCSPYAREDNSILHAVHCTDQLIGKFIGRLQQHPAWQDTVVVLLSDHLGMRNNAYPLFPEDYERTLYFSVVNAHLGTAAQRPAAPMDIAPTVLGLLGVDHTAAFLSGRNLLEAENLTNTDLAMLPEREEAVRFINSHFLSSQESRLVYSLDNIRFRDLDFSAHVEDAELDEDGLRFIATGNDPYLILPKLTIDSPADSYLFVTLETEQASAITLYYSSEDNPAYSEENTSSRPTAVGENFVVFNLENVARTGRLRIDPGLNRGRFLISSIELRTR